MNLLRTTESFRPQPAFPMRPMLRLVAEAQPQSLDRSELQRELVSATNLEALISGLSSSFASPEIVASQELSSAEQDAKMARFIDQYLEEQGSPAAGHNAGALMVKYARQYKIDPLLLLSIAGHETVFGKEGIGVNGLLGVGAYDDNPENAVNDPQFSGIEAQIRRGAETFANLREKGGSGPADSIDAQLQAVNQAGWATDPDWHLGVKRHYDQISQASPPQGDSSKTDDGAEGLEAMGFGYDQPAVNPGTQDTNWNGWGLGWVNQALQSVGVTVPELQAETGAEAYEQLESSGQLQQGDPPPGSVVFFADGERVRLGIVGPDGRLRTTQEPDAEGRTVGDIDMPEDVLGWFQPGAGSGAAKTRPVSDATPKDPESFFITQNTTDWNPNARYTEAGTNANCGPTSLAMAALAFGLLPPGTDPSNPQGIIDAVRLAMTGNDDVGQPTGTGDVTRGAEALGMSHHDVGTLEEVDAALASGQMVVAGSVDHFVLIVGRSPDGGYIVNDPFYTGRPGVVKSVEEMSQWFIGGVAVGP